jgi:uncharacterized GH25 family protein
MGRLIEADKLLENQYRIDDSATLSTRDVVNVEDIEDAPTVEAIPKAELKKFLEEGTKDVSNNVLAIIREDYVHKSEYENRLKADLKAILVELQLEIDELLNHGLQSSDWKQGFTHGLADVQEKVIQQKINALKGDQEGEKNE